MSENGRHQPEPASPASPEQRPAVLPGDRVALEPAGSRRVKTVLLCRELIHDQATEWRWVWLDDGSLLELAPKGCAWYRRHLVLMPATALYESLVAQDGALVRFERRVRAGTSARRPIRVSIDGAPHVVKYTGTAAVQRFGEEPELAPWRSFGDGTEQNVYFGLAAPDGHEVVLGLWTGGVCLSFGQAVAPANLRWER